MGDSTAAAGGGGGGGKGGDGLARGAGACYVGESYGLG